eukprot:6655555-Prymnesium_polylepis.1
MAPAESWAGAVRGRCAAAADEDEDGAPGGARSSCRSTERSPNLAKPSAASALLSPLLSLSASSRSAA